MDIVCGCEYTDEEYDILEAFIGRIDAFLSELNDIDVCEGETMMGIEDAEYHGITEEQLAKMEEYLKGMPEHRKKVQGKLDKEREEMQKAFKPKHINN